jgi:hypothetical protein
MVSRSREVRGHRVPPTIVSVTRSTIDGVANWPRLDSRGRVGAQVMFKANPTRLSNKSIEDYAQRVGEFHDIYEPGGRANIDALVARLGGNFENANDHESLHVAEPGIFTIFVPHFTSARRDRFTKAHPKENRELHFSRGARDRAETEANVFASALLMPKQQFCEAYREFDGDIWQLAARFDVSPQAAEVRAQVLNLT